MQCFSDFSTSNLHKELLSIKERGGETADVMLLYIFNHNVFIAINMLCACLTASALAPMKNTMKNIMNFNKTSAKSFRQFLMKSVVNGML